MQLLHYWRGKIRNCWLKSWTFRSGLFRQRYSFYPKEADWPEHPLTSWEPIRWEDLTLWTSATMQSTSSPGCLPLHCQEMLRSAGVCPGEVFLPLGHVVMACWSRRVAAVLSGGLIASLARVVNAPFHLQQSAGSVAAACFSFFLLSHSQSSRAHIQSRFPDFRVTPSDVITICWFISLLKKMSNVWSCITETFTASL